MATSGWRELTINPEAIASSFGDSDPSLRDVRLINTDLSEDGPTLKLSLALNDYPSHPPIRWKRETSNAVVIQLQCMGITDLSLNRRAGDSRVSCDISRDESGNPQIRLSGNLLPHWYGAPLSESAS